MNFTRQGFIRLDNFEGFEIWAGQQFDRGNWRAQGNVQLYRWLFLEGQYMFGPGGLLRSGCAVPGPREGFEGWRHAAAERTACHRRCLIGTSLFDREATGERVYDLDIIYSRTTYQFSRQFFIRAIAQYDSSRYQVLTDFLASYELRPGTVVYLGYGSLIEQRDFDNGDWVIGHGDYQTSQRGLFFKASYLYRF